MLALLTIHSIVRWVATLVAIALLARLVVGLARKMPFDKLANGLTAAFGGLMDAQALLGILFFVLSGMSASYFPRERWEHFAVMFLAVLVAHLPAAWKKKADDVRTRNTLIAVIVALLLVFAGIAPIGGWMRWWHITGWF